MPTDTKTNRTIHEGRNVKRFREMLGIKQEALASILQDCHPELAEGWNQRKISLLEQKGSIDAALLQQISAALKIPVEAIQNFDEEQAVNIIANTFDNGSILNGINHNPTFHTIDKLVQLHEEKIALYERMLKEKEEMMGRLERLIDGK
jgi:transcriptional regulator with XRE-family HTH domain